MENHNEIMKRIVLNIEKETGAQAGFYMVGGTHWEITILTAEASFSVARFAKYLRGLSVGFGSNPAGCFWKSPLFPSLLSSKKRKKVEAAI